MKIGWSQLTFTPNDEAIATLEKSWGSVIGEPFTPLLFSILGDMYYESNNGVYWLNTGAGGTSRVADSSEEFQSLLGTELIDEWFLPPLVEQLYAAGKIPGPGCCYTPAILPVFAEGKYTVANLSPVSGKEHFALTAEVHSQIRPLADGTKVKLVLGE